MLILIFLGSGTWPGPSIITWQPFAHAFLGQFAQRLQFGELGAIVGNRDRSQAQAVAE